MAKPPNASLTYFNDKQSDEPKACSLAWISTECCSVLKFFLVPMLRVGTRWIRFAYSTSLQKREGLLVGEL